MHLKIFYKIFFYLLEEINFFKVFGFENLWAFARPLRAVKASVM